MSDVLNISYGFLTNQGERTVNEDYLDISTMPDRLSFVLCDGLGGHGNGDVASQYVVNQMKKKLEEGLSMEDSIQQAQDGLLEKQKEEHAEDSMKTTLTCLTIEGDNAHIAHIGDSRVYYFEKSKYRQRTLDHSVPQILVNRGDIREKDIRHHEDRSKLLRVMGIPWDSPKYQIMEPIPLTQQSTFLLCSDGFWELIDEKKMSKTLKRSNTPEEWLEKMEEIIWKNGRGTNMDNYSAIAVFIR